ncbi:MAG: GNAT family N-acetyltransferase [Pseudomonadota bacterium]
MQHAPEIRHVRPHETTVVAAMLARAFADDGMIDWLAGARGHEPDAVRNARAASLFAGYLQLLALPHGMAFTVDGLPGAALWSPPGRWRMGPLTQLRMTPFFLATTGWRRLPPRFVAAQKILAAHPATPHYYLQVLGVDPQAQGQGWGRQLLQHGLTIADEARMPCYLETMNADNVGFYVRYGFRLTGELQLPFSGHRVWLMWRDAG